MANETGEQGEAIPRFRSGVPGLDAVLCGGFLRGAVYIVQGVPGTGKTILAHQVCFEHIRNGGRALYVTVLSENHARMMRNMTSLSFYDRELIPTKLYYVSAYQVLEQEGLKGLTTLIRREIERLGTNLLIFDGLTASDKMTASNTQFKQFVHDLQSVSTLTDCSMLLLTSADDAAVLPEQTMVEGVIELSRRVPAAQSLRYIEVRKFRGSGFLDGRHALEITPAGLVVYPRLESIYGEPADVEHDIDKRVGSGVPSLDVLLGGGFPSGTTTAIVGPSGSGKTTLGLHFLSLSTPDEPGLHFGFYETPTRLRHKAKSLGIDLAALEASGALELSWVSPTERVLDRLGNKIIDLVRARNVRRVIIDGLDGLRLSAPGPERLSRFVTALTNELRTLGCTTIFSLETPQIFSTEMVVPMDGVSVVSENLILLRYVEIDGALRRLLAILKVRDSAFDSRLQEMTVGANGIVVTPNFGRAEGLLAGYARRNVVSLTDTDDARSDAAAKPRS
jgi:circadian clock protein KaiC